MNLIFLTMSPFYDLDAHNIYADLLKEFVLHGHKPYLVSPCERKNGLQTELSDKGEYAVLRVRIGNTSNVSFIEKGISTVLLEKQYIRAIQKHLSDVVFGLILYSTPPVTLANVVRYLKNTYGAPTYLLLKDIFPQNAVDLGMMPSKGPIYQYFRYKEKALYGLSDTIGCMSRANISYIIRNNPQISEKTVELCPNAITPCKLINRQSDKNRVRKAFGVNEEATLYVFGGNLGKPQGISHLIHCLEQNADRSDRFFIICGNGTEFPRLKAYIDDKTPSNIRLVSFLPKVEFDALLRGCDVGLIFLDYRFTIPNYPSRILSYMENAMPVIVCSDQNTDVGTDASKNGYGYSCTSDDPGDFTACVDCMNVSDVSCMGQRARAYLETHFTAQRCFERVIEKVQL